MLLNLFPNNQTCIYHFKLFHVEQLLIIAIKITEITITSLLNTIHNYLLPGLYLSFTTIQVKFTSLTPLLSVPSLHFRKIQFQFYLFFYLYECVPMYRIVLLMRFPVQE